MAHLGDISMELLVVAQYTGMVVEPLAYPNITMTSPPETGGGEGGTGEYVPTGAMTFT